MSESAPKRYKASRLGRISVIALHAFTQLVRMKVFYFLIVFAVITLGSNFFELPQHTIVAGLDGLRAIKSWSLGTMTLFSVVLAIVATSLLLPKDVEDRTLYTILAKPVPRLDYLTGKLLGVLALVFVSLLLMDGLMSGVLHVRTGIVLHEQLAIAEAREFTPEDIESLRTDILAQGSTWSLQGAVAAVFLRAAVIAAVALLISTFSSSTLFTTIISFLIYFIGHFQAEAREIYLKGGEIGESTFVTMTSLLVTLILPDFQIFNVIDAVIEGQVIPLLTFAKLAGIALYYTTLFTLISWFIFAEKEF
jgi:ABC-2 type transport system permease protein